MPLLQAAAQPAAAASGPAYSCHGNMSSSPGACPTCGQPMQPVTGGSGGTPITSPVPAARAILEAVGLHEATEDPVGIPTTPGYLVTSLRALGPDRAAVRWRVPGAAAGWSASPGSDLARCRDALHAAGCRCEFVIADDGGYLAVLPPADSAQPAGTR